MKQTSIIILVVVSFLSWFLFIIVYFVDKHNTVPIQMPRFYQIFPVDRYPGLKCYVIRTDVRQMVITTGCEIVYVQSDNITIGNYVIPRQTPGQRCNRCYLSDYLNIVGFVLFGRPEKGIEPLAPKGAVILEDDAVICNAALPYLDQCFEGQYNCILGDGAWMNYFAGAHSVQPEPDKYGWNRFTEIEQLYQHRKMNRQAHADLFTREHKRHVIAVDLVNHVNSVSTLYHHNPEQLKCMFNESLAGPKVIVERHKDIRIYRD